MNLEAAREYDVFISYRREKSAKHAIALRDTLYALDKRHGHKALRVFLDRVSLRYGTLSERIDAALRVSRHLVVLIDSKTHLSPWVDREVRDWLAFGGSIDRLFLVRTEDVDLTWDDEKGNFCHPELLPPSIKDSFTAEQKYANFLVPTSRVGAFDLLPLYATLASVDPDSLKLDEHRFLQRRRRALGVIIAMLSFLLVVAIVTGIVAVENWVRADRSAEQARAEAQAAEALLELPVSPVSAIEKVVAAGASADSHSIRSALIEVANGTGTLEATMNLMDSTSATALTGLAVDPSGRHLSAWGPSSNRQESVVATWLVDSGDLIRSFKVPGSVTELLEVAGQGYLACVADQAFQIDWNTLERSVIYEGGSLNCDARTSGVSMGVLEMNSGGDVETSKVIGYTTAGKLYQSWGYVPEYATDSPYLFVMQGREDDEDGLRLAMLTPDGFSDPIGFKGAVMSTGASAVTLRDLSGMFWAYTAVDGESSLVPLDAPSNAVSLVAWQGASGSVEYFWVDALGVVGSSLSGTTLEVQGASSAAEVRIHQLDRDAALLVAEESVWLIEFSGSVTAEYLGSIDSSSGSDFEGCGDGAGAFKNAVVNRNTERLLERTFEGVVLSCKALSVANPVSVNGVNILGQGALNLDRAVVGGDRLFVGDSAGLVSVFHWGDESVPWRVNDHTPVLVGADGQAFLRSGLDASYSLTGEVSVVGKGGFSHWRLPRPDGQGGVFERGGRLWSAADGMESQAEFAEFSEFDYEPDVGFEADREAAEAQRLTCWSIDYEPGIGDVRNRFDCVTGEELPPGPRILSYVVSPTLGRIVAHDGSRLLVTTWSPSDPRARPTTYTAGLIGDWPSSAAVSGDGERVVVVGDDHSHAVEYALGNGVLQPISDGYPVRDGAGRMVSYSADGSLLAVFDESGAFELYDVATRRRLARGEHGLGGGLDYLGVVERDGYLVATMANSGTGAVIGVSIPVQRELLIRIFCGVHEADGCGE